MEILELCFELCGFKAKDNLARISLTMNEIFSARDWVGLNDQQIDNLVVMVKKSQTMQRSEVPLGSKNKIRFMRNFIKDLYHQQHGKISWSNVTLDDFRSFCVGNPLLLSSSASMSPSGQNTAVTCWEEYEPYQLAGFPEDYVDVTYVPEIFEKEARKEEVPETLEEDAQDDLESSLKRHISVRHHES